MAKGVYAVVDGKARKVNKGYCVVDGTARKLKKQYVVIDGKTRLVWSSSNGRYVAVAKNSNDEYGIYITDDLKKWDRKLLFPTKVESDAKLNYITLNNRCFLTYTVYYFNSYIFYSDDDGETWTQGSTTAKYVDPDYGTADYTIGNIKLIGDVLMGYTMSSQLGLSYEYGHFAYSYDGINWSVVPYDVGFVGWNSVSYRYANHAYDESIDAFLILRHYYNNTGNIEIKYFTLSDVKDYTEGKISSIYEGSTYKQDSSTFTSFFEPSNRGIIMEYRRYDTYSDQGITGAIKHQSSDYGDNYYYDNNGYSLSITQSSSFHKIYMYKENNKFTPNMYFIMERDHYNGSSYSYSYHYLDTTSSFFWSSYQSFYNQKIPDALIPMYNSSWFGANYGYAGIGVINDIGRIGVGDDKVYINKTSTTTIEVIDTDLTFHGSLFEKK